MTGSNVQTIISRYQAGSNQLNRRHTLLIEHYEPTVLMAEAMFGCMDHDLDIVATVPEALRKISTKHYSLILININLQTVGGLYMSKRIREFAYISGLPPLTIIGFTTYDSLEHQVAAVVAGFDKCLTRFVTPDYINRLFEHLPASAEVLPQRLSA